MHTSAGINYLLVLILVSKIIDASNYRSVKTNSWQSNKLYKSIIPWLQNSQ